MKTKVIQTTECKMVMTYKIGSMKEAASEINRLINALWSQGACFVDVTWDKHKKCFVVFARRNTYPNDP